MNGKISDITYRGLIICFTFVACVNGANSQQKYDRSRKIGTVERWLLRDLNLPADVNDDVIIHLLDDRVKFHSAIGLVRYWKISSAVPKLLEIFNSCDPNTGVCLNKKMLTAMALCDFGNTDWVPEIKGFLNDPNRMLPYYYKGFRGNRDILLDKKIRMAGLLARTGDYSFYDLVASHINDDEKGIRLTVISELRNFGNETDPVTNKAADTLLAIATSDPEVHLRERAIYSLERLAIKRPEVKDRIIKALESNLNSNDEHLKFMSQMKLKSLHDSNDPNIPKKN